MRRLLVRLVPATLVFALLPGCAAKPRERPLPTSDIATGPQTIEYVRRQLEGTWNLERFEIIEAGVPRDVRAQARLTYDAYGNLAVEGVVLDPLVANGTDAGRHPLLNYSGRIVIDPIKQEFRVADIRSDAPADENVRQVLDPSQPRRYSFQDNQLTLVMVLPDGQPTARATFSRAR